jgi:hypothetical protein
MNCAVSRGDFPKWKSKPMTVPPGMRDRELRKLLFAIRDLALVPYPFPDGARVDDRLCIVLGQIAGLASKALSETEPTP